MHSAAAAAAAAQVAEMQKGQQQQQISQHYAPQAHLHHDAAGGGTPYHQQHAYQPLLMTNAHVLPAPKRSPCFPFSFCRVFVRRYKERSKRIDVVSRLVFPIGYACFNGGFSDL